MMFFDKNPWSNNYFSYILNPVLVIYIFPSSDSLYFPHTTDHSVFKTVYVSVYKKLDSSMPWVYDMVYKTSYFISKLHKLFNLLDTLLFSTFEEIIWSESDS